jgi:uncharacterized protein (TIRG00374 family)
VIKIIARHIATGLGVLFSISALFWLAQQFDLAELPAILNKLDYAILSPIPLFIVLSFSIRAQRWRLLVEHQPPIRYWTSFSALMIGYLLNNILPARAGDLARALDLGKSEKISRTKVFATLVTERTADLAITLVFLALALLTYPALPEWLQQSGIAVAVVASAAVVFLIVAHTTGRRWIPALVGLLAHRLPDRIGSKILQMVTSALDGIAGIFRPANALAFIVLTGFLWILEVAIVYLVAVGVGLPLAPGNALFVLLVLALGSMVPSSPGFVGTYEFFGVTALAIVGHDGPTALAFIILLHLFTLLGSTILGVMCLLFRNRVSVPLKDVPIQ